MMYPLFPLEFDRFFPRKNLINRGESPLPHGKNLVKIQEFFLYKQLQSGILPYSYNVLITSPLPCQALPGPVQPLQLIFFVSTVFFPGAYPLFPLDKPDVSLA